MRSYPETYNPEEEFRDEITLILKRVLVLIEANRKNWSPDKTADISRRYHWFPREMKAEEGAQKFHTDDVSLSMQIWTVTLHQYGISVVDPRTSFRGKPVAVSGNIDCLLTPQNLGREREKSNFSHENYSG